MRSGRHSLAALSWVLLVGCGDEQPVPDPAPDVPVVEVQLLQPPLNLESQPKVLVGGARDTVPGQNLYLVSAALLLERGGLLLATEGSQSILEYDSIGEFVAQHGGPGEGPGEYRPIRALYHLPGDTLAVWDVGSRRITYLDPRREVSRTISLATIADNDPLIISTLDLYPVGDSVFVAATRPLNGQAHRRGPGHSRDIHYLVMLDREGREVSPVGTIAGYEWYTASQGDGATVSPFSYRFFVAAADDAFYLGDGRGPYLTEYSVGGAPIRRLHLPIDRATITESAWRESIDHFLETRIAPEDRPEEAELLEEALAVDSFPAYIALAPSQDGLIWLRLRTPPRSPQRWLAVDPQTNTAREIELPPGSRVLAATAGRVAVLSEDEWEREEVRVYRISETAELSEEIKEEERS